MVDPAVFVHLQAKIDEDAHVKEEIREILQSLERQGRLTQSILSKVHSTPSSELPATIEAAEKAIQDQVGTIARLSAVASDYPYYRYNGMWTRDVQNATFAIVLCGWLGGFNSADPQEPGRLLTIEEVGEVMKVPVNLKDRDDFHLTIEEYLHALINLIEELARLAVNSVTLGDYQRPLLISRFVKDLHAGFQILNLKNDSLRRRSDSIKYNVGVADERIHIETEGVIHR
ncbi:MAG: hypothetical protein M1832_003961 [Thelocarpon impressellum]|nr:MAG: hypothetical protein M1832_003961 [Thelocarpon impressellum]